jgi:hypothetical protein
VSAQLGAEGDFFFLFTFVFRMVGDQSYPFTSYRTVQSVPAPLYIFLPPHDSLLFSKKERKDKLEKFEKKRKEKLGRD